MAKEKKLVQAITSMDEDFAQWYTDVVKKAELCGYTSVKGCMAIKPAGYAIWENIQHELDRKLLCTAISGGAQSIQWTVLRSVCLIKRQMQTVFSRRKLLWISAGLPFVSVDMKFFSQKIPIKPRIQAVLLK